MAVTVVIIEGVVVGLILILIRNIWGHAYSNEAEVVRYVSAMMPYLALSHFVNGTQCILSGTNSYYL